MPRTLLPSGHRSPPMWPAARCGVLAAAALAMVSPAANAAESALAPLAIAALGVVAVGLGALAAALAYRLGQRQRPEPVDAAASPRGGARSPGLLSADPAPAQALADGLPGPAVLLVARGADWQLQHANAAARQAWPGCGEGSWPAGLHQQLQARRSDPAAPAGPWQYLAAADWLLAWQASAPAAGPATEAAQRAQAETFGFTLSHDLRAPLRVVEGFTRIVKEDYGAQLDRVGNDHLERVLGAAARMNMMIDAMLALARLSQQPLARQPVDLAQLAGFVIEDLRRGAPDRVVEVEIEPGLVAQGDPTLLRLVLENLLGNAWKYSSKAARARIELRRESASGTDELGFVVLDNGAGFDMRSADRLFGLFQRLHSASDFPGHGVGLASVRRIVERHGGRIWAESEPGRGTRFHVVLAGG